MMLRRLILALVVATAAVPASAQTGPEHAHSIGVGPQSALPYTGHGPPGVQITWRRWVSPRLGVGTDFRWWQRTATSDVDSPSQGLRGREVLSKSSYGLGVGVLGRESIGRLSFVAGAGPGFFVDATRHERQVNDLRDAGRTAVRSIGVQGLMELEWRSPLEHRRHELARPWRPGQLESHRAVIRFDRDLEPEEPAALALGLDDACDRREGVGRRPELEPEARGQLLAAVGLPHQPGQQALAPRPARLRRQRAEDW